MEFGPDLVTEATSFFDQMSDAEGFWRNDCLGSFPNGRRTFRNKQPEISLGAFTETFRWRSIALDPAVLASRLALRFAHVL